MLHGCCGAILARRVGVGGDADPPDLSEPMGLVSAATWRQATDAGLGGTASRPGRGPAGPEYGLDLPVDSSGEGIPAPPAAVPPRPQPAPAPVSEPGVFSGLDQVHPAAGFSGNRAQCRAAARHAERRH